MSVTFKKKKEKKVETSFLVCARGNTAGNQQSIQECLLSEAARVLTPFVTSINSEEQLYPPEGLIFTEERVQFTLFVLAISIQRFVGYKLGETKPVVTTCCNDMIVWIQTQDCDGTCVYCVAVTFFPQCEDGVLVHPHPVLVWLPVFLRQVLAF